MRIGILIGFAIALSVTDARATDAQSPGTYRLAICAGPCASSDSGVVRGSLVLFRDPIRVDTLTAATRAALARDQLLVRRAVPVNACFALRRSASHIDGRELYAGIIERSFTHWVSDGPLTRVMLYLSPDASYTITGTFDGSVYSGSGGQVNCCGGVNPTTSFRAVRVGEPDLGACLSR